VQVASVAAGGEKALEKDPGGSFAVRKDGGRRNRESGSCEAQVRSKDRAGAAAAG